MTNQNSSGKNTMKTFIWVVLGVVVAPLILYNLYTGLVIGKIGFPGGFSLEFKEKNAAMDSGGKVAELSESERAERQAELQKQVREEVQKLGNSGQTQPQPVQQQQSQPPQINISGRWRSAEGLSYEITQNGSDVVIQEINPIYGITAVGQGTIAQQNINLSYTTVFETNGTGSLRVSDDGAQITGTFFNQSTGATVPVTLFR